MSLMESSGDIGERGRGTDTGTGMRNGKEGEEESITGKKDENIGKKERDKIHPIKGLSAIPRIFGEPGGDTESPPLYFSDKSLSHGGTKPASEEFLVTHPKVYDREEVKPRKDQKDEKYNLHVHIIAYG